MTFRAPRSIGLLWPLGSGPATEAVMQGSCRATALWFLGSHAAVTCRQVAGIPPTRADGGVGGSQVRARMSREGDPQQHTRRLTVNLTRRMEDSRVVAWDGSALYRVGPAAGWTYQAVAVAATEGGVELDRHNTRELAGFMRVSAGVLEAVGDDRGQAAALGRPAWRILGRPGRWRVGPLLEGARASVKRPSGLPVRH